MSFLINPYAFLAAGGDYESIATVSVGSGGASSIEFTSIPGTYQHLQIRMIARSNRSDNNDDTFVRVNSDTGSNYAFHRLFGNGSIAATGAGVSTTYWDIRHLMGNLPASGIFAAGIMDILDYANTSKHKTMRVFMGNDHNGAGNVGISSGLWMSTSAVSSLSIYSGNGASWVQHTTAALYGIKA